MKQGFRSRLMYMSWEIQRKENLKRKRALKTAWLLYRLEDITVYYLLKKHSHTNTVSIESKAKTLTLFNT